MKQKILSVCFLVGVLGFPVPSSFAQVLGKHNLIYGPTPDKIVEKMFEVAKLTKDDVFFDLGCGDGRVVAMAAQRIGCRSIGVDLSHDRIRECMDLVKTKKLENLVEQGLVEFRLGDALKIPDMEQATVIFLYMTDQFMEMFKPIAQKRLKPGTRIVAHDYRWLSPGWEPDERVEVRDERSRMHVLYRWTAKKK